MKERVKRGRTAVRVSLMTDNNDGKKYCFSQTQNAFIVATCAYLIQINVIITVTHGLGPEQQETNDASSLLDEEGEEIQTDHIKTENQTLEVLLTKVGQLAHLNLTVLEYSNLFGYRFLINTNTLFTSNYILT